MNNTTQNHNISGGSIYSGGIYGGEPTLLGNYENELFSYENTEKELSKSKLPSSFDATDWVDEWKDTIKKVPTIPWDYECMHTWFCNAIMSGFYEARRQESQREKFVYILRSSQSSGVIATYTEEPAKEQCDKDYSLYLKKDLTCIEGTDIPLAGQGSEWNCVLEKWKMDSTNRIHEQIKIQYK